MKKTKSKNTKKHSPKLSLQISETDSQALLTERMLKTLFNQKEIYKYTISVSQDYKEFQEEVVNHLNFLDKVCDEGLKQENIMALNGIRNHIVSFLLRNHLTEYKNDKI